ncbi:MAG TPA: hypothetical protein VLF90_01380 [Patescibacteria group bacterium]|nr:hypothetical protein [Patescibacteria group bacterium]
MNIPSLNIFAGGPDSAPAPYEGADGGITIARERFGHVDHAEHTLDTTVANLEAILALPAHDPERVNETEMAAIKSSYNDSFSAEQTEIVSTEPTPAAKFDPNDPEAREQAARDLAMQAHLDNPVVSAARQQLFDRQQQ